MFDVLTPETHGEISSLAWQFPPGYCNVDDRFCQIHWDFLVSSADNVML